MFRKLIEWLRGGPTDGVKVNAKDEPSIDDVVSMQIHNQALRASRHGGLPIVRFGFWCYVCEANAETGLFEAVHRTATYPASMDWIDRNRNKKGGE